MTATPGANWTEGLREPLASAARGGRWCRIEEHRGGGWILLSDEGAGDVDWWHLPSDGTADSLKPLDPLDDHRLPELGRFVRDSLRRSDTVTLLAWRVGSRAIFRVENDAGPHMVKLYRKDRDVLRRWLHLGEHSHPRWSVPTIDEWDPKRRMLRLQFCPGESLNHRWLSGRATEEESDAVASVLEWLASAPLPDDFPAHPIEEEIRILSERLPVFERTLAEPSSRAAPLVARVTTALRALPEVAPVFSHRDFHDKQLLIDGDRGTLIDLDLAAAAHPALDVGNILAHLQLRALKGAAIDWASVARPIATRAKESRSIDDSLPVWTAGTLLRLALIYARRFRQPGVIESLFDATEAALDRSGEWKDIL